MQDHLKQQLDHPVLHHFNRPGHSVADLRAVAIERVLPAGDNQLRKRKKLSWVNKYESSSTAQQNCKTYLNYGVNARNYAIMF